MSAPVIVAVKVDHLPAVSRSTTYRRPSPGTGSQTRLTLVSGEKVPKYTLPSMVNETGSSRHPPEDPGASHWHRQGGQRGRFLRRVTRLDDLLVTSNRSLRIQRQLTAEIIRRRVGAALSDRGPGRNRAGSARRGSCRTDRRYPSPWVGAIAAADQDCIEHATGKLGAHDIRRVEETPVGRSGTAVHIGLVSQSARYPGMVGRLLPGRSTRQMPPPVSAK